MSNYGEDTLNDVIEMGKRIEDFTEAQIKDLIYLSKNGCQHIGQHRLCPGCMWDGVLECDLLKDSPHRNSKLRAKELLKGIIFDEEPF